MADLGGTYDATHGEQMGDTSPLPPGEYLAQIVKSEWRDARNHSETGNRFISLEFEVVDGDAKGRRFWSNLNLVNQNGQAVEIAQRELNSICHAIGKLRVGNTEELHHRPILVKVGLQKNDATRNEVKGYKPAGAPSGSGAFAGAGAAGAQSAKAAPPWAS